MTLRTVTSPNILDLHGAARVGATVVFTLMPATYSATEHVPLNSQSVTIASDGSMSTTLYCPATYQCVIAGTYRFAFTLPDSTAPTTLEALHATSSSPPTAVNDLQVVLDSAALRGNNLLDLTNVATARTNLGVYSTTQTDTLLAAKASTTALGYAVPSRNILDVIDVVASDHTAAVKAAFVSYPHWHIPPNTTVKLTEQLRTGTPACVVIPYNGSLTGHDRDTSVVSITTDHASNTSFSAFLLDGSAIHPASQYIANLNVVGSATTPMTWTNGQCSVFYENDGQLQAVFRTAPLVIERVRFSAYSGFPIHSETARLIARGCTSIDCGNGFNNNGVGSSVERCYFERAEGCEMSGINATVAFSIFKDVFNAAVGVGGFNTANHPEYHGATVMGNYIDGVVAGVGIIVAQSMSDTRIIGNYIQKPDNAGIQVSTSTTFLTNGIIISDNHLVSCGKTTSGTRIGMYILGDNCRIHRNRVYNRSDITTHASLFTASIATCANCHLDGNTLDASGGGQWAVDLNAVTNLGWGPSNVLTTGSSGLVQVRNSSTFRDARYLNDQLINASSNRTALVTDRSIYVTAGGSARTITLPTAVGIPGLRYRVRKVDAGIGTVTVDAAGTETIDGALTKVFSSQYTGTEIESDGANWHSTT